jgi:hypothetical protein
MQKQHFDLIVYGTTPGGIACAVRAAREGLSVLLAHRHRHIGGFITSGAGGWEAPYDGLRSPVYAEIRQGATQYYCDTFGEGSPQHLASLPNPATRRHLDRPKIEPKVAEMLFLNMIEAEPTLELWTGWNLAETFCGYRRLEAILLVSCDCKGSPRRVEGDCFVDATYEGDLAAMCGVTMQVGRESRETYHEPHAGVIYSKVRPLPPGQSGFPKDASDGKLNIRTNGYSTGEIVEVDESGQADASVMAYNYRLILTKNPTNRVAIPEPADRERGTFSGKPARSIVPNLPNDKIAWNGGGRLIGPQNDYPEADWDTREAISRRYLDAALKELWLVQNDPEVEPAERGFWKDYGLAADEFPDNANLPYEIYVREARRLVGRYVFKEFDNIPAQPGGRTPLHHDSIAITDWPLDSVACLDRELPGTKKEGVFFLGEESRPAQVPFRCLLPQELDNLMVPVCLSASHVGWGALRLEPVWMQTGEAAGFAAALAKRKGCLAAEVSMDALLHNMVEARCMISFFNDVEVLEPHPWIPAFQFLGTRGFFTNYDARPNACLGDEAKRWSELCVEQGVVIKALDPAMTRAEAAMRIYRCLKNGQNARQPI